MESSSERILILAPGEGSAAPVCEPLEGTELAYMVCAGAEALCAEIEQGAGAVLLMEAACSAAAVRQLAEVLEAQPPWSDLPIVVFAAHEQRSPGVRRMDVLRPFYNVILLEQPVHRSTLITALRSRVRARRHQYQVRDLLARLEHSNEMLEERVRRRTVRLQEAHDRLRQEMTRREQLQQQNMEISTQERQRFAQELHDGLCQQLSSISFLTYTLREKLRGADEEIRQRMDKVAQLTDRAIRETRALSHSLFPPVLDDQCLEGALRELADTMSQAHEVSCQVEVEAAAEPDDQRVALNFYRITQEALSNAIRHGRAQTIRVRLARAGGDVLLQIEDDGVGMDARPTNGASEGIGMRTMRRRAESIGAALEVQSSEAGSGTAARCRLPQGERAVALAVEMAN